MLQAGQGPPGNDRGCAQASEFQGDGRANSSSGAGHQRDFPVQLVFHLLDLSSSLAAFRECSASYYPLERIPALRCPMEGEFWSKNAACLLLKALWLSKNHGARARQVTLEQQLCI